MAAHLPSNGGPAALPPSTPPTWDHSALLAALNNVAYNPGGSTSEWFLDTGASSHMSSTPGSTYQGGDSAM
ncbi:unnamed protein product [Urochloa humidicola]